MSKLGFAVAFYRPDLSGSGSNITNGVTENITINFTDSITLNEIQKAIIAQMRDNPKITTKMLAEIFGIADRNVKNHVKTLKQVGLIEREGSGNDAKNRRFPEYENGGWCGIIWIYCFGKVNIIMKIKLAKNWTIDYYPNW